jgi:hypothetical protein
MLTTSPAFVVARVWNAHGPQDYLRAWDRKWGTSCSGLPVAMRFPSRAAAEQAAAKATALVPTLTSGTPIAWTVLEG